MVHGPLSLDGLDLGGAGAWPETERASCDPLRLKVIVVSDWQMANGWREIRTLKSNPVAGGVACAVDGPGRYSRGSGRGARRACWGAARRRE
jgi:hypothetical protein